MLTWGRADVKAREAQHPQLGVRSTFITKPCSKSKIDKQNRLTIGHPKPRLK